MSTFVAPSRTIALAVILGALLWPDSGYAQPMAREDNIWGGKDHQPTPSVVLEQERLHGFASSGQHERLENEQVELLYQSLIGSRSGMPS